MIFERTVNFCISPMIFLFLILGCSPTDPLLDVDPRVVELSLTLADNCFGTPSSDINPTLTDLKSILDEVYQGEQTPQTNEKKLRDIDTGYSLEPYPPDSDTASAIVARPLQASLHKSAVAFLWDNQLEVWTTDTITRYKSYERTYTEGDKSEFLNGNQDVLKCTNHVVDLGQRGISFEYDTEMTFIRYKGDSLPPEGVIVECSYMPSEAVRVAGGYNAYMTKLYAVHVYYPIDTENTYRVVASWVKAGGGLWIFGAGANSGDVGQGIRDEFDCITNFISTH